MFQVILIHILLIFTKKLKHFNKRAKWFHKMISCFCFSVNLEPYQTHPKFETKGMRIKFMHTSHGNPVVTAIDMWAKLNIYTIKYSSNSTITSTSTTNYLNEKPPPPQSTTSWSLPSSRNRQALTLFFCRARFAAQILFPIL
jgi:hypothetical protein